LTSSRAKKLLEAMRQSPNNWSLSDLIAVYEGHYFEIRRGTNHDIAVHCKHRHLRGTIPHHKSFAQAYVRQAVKLVDQAIELDMREEPE